MRPKRKRILIVLASLALGFGLFLSFLLFTQPGARFLGKVVVPRVPGSLKYIALTGRIMSHMTLDNIHFENDKMRVAIGHLELDWKPSQLFGRTAHIEALEIRGLDLEMLPASAAKEKPAEEKPKKPGPPRSPIGVRIDRGRISDISVRTPDSLEVRDAELEFAGTLDSLRLRAHATIRGPELPEISLRDLRATSSLTAIDLEALVLELLEGRVTAQAQAAWYPAIRWEAKVQADSLHPGPLTPAPAEWPGSVSLRLTTHGTLTAEGEPTGQIDVPELSGDLRHLPLHGRATVELTSKKSGTVDTSIDWGSLTLQGGGQFGDELDLNLAAAVQALEEFAPNVRGATDLTAHVTGPRIGPRVAGVLNGRGIAVAETKTDSLVAHFSVGTRPADASNLDVRVLGIVASGQTFPSLHLEGSGSQTKHELALALDGDSLDVALSFRGGYVDSTWSGALERADVQEVKFGSWSLRSPTHLSVAPATASIDSMCFESLPTSITLRGTWSKVDGWKARMRVADVDDRFWKKQMPENAAFEGRVFLNADLTGRPDRKVLGKAEAEIRAGIIRLTTEDSVVEQFALRTAVVRCTAGEARADLGLEIGVDRQDGGSIVAIGGDFQVEQGIVADSTVLAHVVRGSVHGEVTDLYFIDALSPEIKRSSGRIDMRLEADGPMGKPVLGGEAKLTDVNVTIPALGLELRELQVVAAGDPRTEFKLTGRVLSGAGSLEIEGSSPLVPTEEKPAQMRIHGENFKAMNTAEIDVELSTDLEIAVTDKRAQVAGTISLPLAKVELIEVPPTAIGPSPDAVIVGPKRETKPPLETQADVTVALGDNVTFRGFGTYAKLEGQLRVQQEGVKLPTGTGEVRVTDGYYRAYGQNLKIEKGRLLFAGAVANPGLEIRAFREATDGTIAGIDIGGTGEEPKLTLYSDPSMAENNVLSYIITGRPIEDGTKEDEAKVNSAAAMLGGNVMSTYLGSKVGLDEARIESGTGNNDASFVAGKYITPKIYASYAIGLFDQANLMRLRYIMSPQWSVQTETGRTMGADVLYSLERGKGGEAQRPTPDEASVEAASRKNVKKSP